MTAARTAQNSGVAIVVCGGFTAYDAGEEHYCIGGDPCSDDKPADLRGIRCGQKAAGFGRDGDGLGEGGATSQGMEHVVNPGSCAGCDGGVYGAALLDNRARLCGRDRL